MKLDTLPQEILQAMLEYMPMHSLKQLSLVSKQFDRLAKPVLFRHLDLRRYPPRKLLQFYEDLLSDKTDGRAPLTGLRVGTIAYRFDEEMVEEPEFAGSLTAMIEIMDGIGGASLMELSLGLTGGETLAFQRSLLPSIQRLLGTKPDSVSSFKVDLESFVSKSESDEPAAILAVTSVKLSKILSLFRPNSIEALHFNNIAIATVSQELQARLASDALKCLSIQNCIDFFGPLPGASKLRRLSIAWHGLEGPAAQASVATALRLIAANAATLRTILLQHFSSRRAELFKDPHQAVITLPNLVDLQVADTAMGAGSLLDLILDCTELPRLATLALETEDILNLDVDTGTLLTSMPALRRLELSENRLGGVRQPPSKVPSYGDLLAKCKNRKIQLRTAYSSLRCDTFDDMAYELDRLQSLAESMTRIHLACLPAGLTAVRGLERVKLPCLEQVWLGMSDVMYPSDGNGSDFSSDDSVLYEFLQWLHAPGCRELQVILFVNGRSANYMLPDLHRALEDRVLPRLEEISGSLMAAPSMSAEAFELCERAIRGTCDATGIEHHALKFVSRASPAGGHGEDDEEILDSDSDEGEDDEDVLDKHGDDGEDEEGVLDSDSDDGESKSEESWVAESGDEE